MVCSQFRIAKEKLHAKQFYHSDIKVIIKNNEGTAVENLQILQPIVADEVLGYIAILGDNDLV